MVTFTIILLVLAMCTCTIACIHAIRSLTESQNESHRIAYDRLLANQLKERQWWQHQFQLAINRLQFPDIAAAQTSQSQPGTQEPPEVRYVDERVEFDLQESR